MPLITSFIQYIKQRIKVIDMPSALILIVAKIGTMKSIHEKLKGMDEVKQVSMLTGPYDIMAIVRADDMREISKILVTGIRNIDGVEDTVTNVVIG